MRTSLARRPGWLGIRDRLPLALALALCACGGGGDGAGEAGDAPAAESAAAPAAAAAAPVDTCTGPPPAYAADLLTGPWDTLVARLAADGATFPQIPGNDTTAEMRLCPGCEKVAVRRHSSRLTPCLGPEHLTGEPRILSMFTVQGDFPAQHGWEALSRGDTVFVFASVVEGPAVLVYNSGGTARKAPDDAMRFKHCQDGHESSRLPQVRFYTAGNQPDEGKGKGPPDDVGCPWEQCRTGCCCAAATPIVCPRR